MANPLAAAAARTSFRIACLLGALFATSASLHAAPTGPAPKPIAPAPSPSASPLAVKMSIERFTLDNGLRVVINREPASPTIAVVVWYDVGSRDEKDGEGGFAHLFEHLMFEGSAGVPRGVHDKIVESRGGEDNASTSEDWTRYWERMPSSELAATLYLEADRMRALNVTEEAFENQRKVVQEEYRLRVANKPYVPGYFRLRELMFEGFHPYAHPAIGSMKELDAAQLAWVQKFHAQWYAPNNAVLVIAGDVDVPTAKSLVKKYFDPVARVATPAREPLKFSGRTKPSGPETLTDALAATPMTYLGWTIPGDGAPEHYALEIAATILSDGDSSRYSRKLVKDLSVAQSVEAETEGHRGPDAFVITAHLSEKGKIDDVEKRLWAEIDDLARNGPTAAEMAKARAKIEHSFVFGLQTNMSRALELAKMEGERGDANALSLELTKYEVVTKEQVKAAVAKYLKRETLAHVRVLPKPKPDDKPAGRADGKTEKKGAKK